MAYLLRIRAFVLATGALMAACSDQDAGIVEDRAAVASDNGLYGVNGLSAVNGLSGVNGLMGVNGVSAVNGLYGVNGLSSTQGLMTSSAGRSTVSYLVRCALGNGDTLVKQDPNGASYTFAGALGLAPQWKYGACDANCQQIVSACLMAHVNTTGRHISLWLDSPVKLGLGRDPAHPMQESAFFGNIFTSPPQAYFCNGFDWDRGPVSGRIGANQSGSPYKNPFGTNALCQNNCSKVGFWGEAYGSCNGGWNNVITVFRDFDPNVPYTICNRVTNRCLDVLNGSTAAGAIIDLSPPNNANNQKFYFERVNAVSDSGQYRIRSAASGLYLDISGAQKTAGAGLIQWPSGGSPNQLWYMVQILAGSYNLVNVNSGMQLTAFVPPGSQVVQVPGGSYSDFEMFKLTLAQ